MSTQVERLRQEEDAWVISHRCILFQWSPFGSGLPVTTEYFWLVELPCMPVNLGYGLGLTEELPGETRHSPGDLGTAGHS